MTTPTPTPTYSFSKEMVLQLSVLAERDGFENAAVILCALYGAMAEGTESQLLFKCSEYAQARVTQFEYDRWLQEAGKE